MGVIHRGEPVAGDELHRFEALAGVTPRSLLWATELDVLPLDRVIERRDGYLVVRSPRNPAHWWGNLLLFDDPSSSGDGPRWEALFDAELGRDPRIEHRSFGWDRTDGAMGSAREEFVARGYQLEENVGLVASAEQLRPHPRENRAVLVRALDPAAGADEELWAAVVDVQVAARDERVDEESHREFSRARLEDLRALFRLGRGAWYVALEPDRGEVLGSCGMVVSAARARFQAVDTVATHRRRGICSRLVVEAAYRSAERFGAERFVIAADANYHALALYESLGFEPLERVCGVVRWPARAAR